MEKDVKIMILLFAVFVLYTCLLVGAIFYISPPKRSACNIAPQPIEQESDLVCHSP